MVAQWEMVDNGLADRAQDGIIFEYIRKDPLIIRTPCLFGTREYRCRRLGAGAAAPQNLEIYKNRQARMVVHTLRTKRSKALMRLQKTAI